MATPSSKLGPVLRGMTILLLAAFLLLVGGYMLWQPGLDVRDGRHDRGTNGIWLQHGWLGHDDWFRENGRDVTLFRDDERIASLAERLKQHGIAIYCEWEMDDAEWTVLRERFLHTSTAK